MYFKMNKNFSAFGSCEQGQKHDVDLKSSHLYKVKSLEEYKTLMDKIYGKSNFLITELEKIYYHHSFAGCFIDEMAQASFQIWKCKYTVDQKSGETIPSYLIFNATSLAHCNVPLTDNQCNQTMQSIRESIIPQLVSTHETMSQSKLVNVAFASHGGSIYQYILRNYSHLESVSFASLYYTFQDNFKLAGASSKKTENGQPSLDPVSKFLMPQNEDSFKTGEENLFLDARDCTGKPMIWSEEVKETEMATMRPVCTISDSSVVRETTVLAPSSRISKL